MLGHLIENCYKDFMDKYGKLMLVSLRQTVRDVDIFEHAINLAGQAIVSCI
jgi:hypothetical protein